MALPAFPCRWIVIHDVEYCAVAVVVYGSHTISPPPFSPTTGFSVVEDGEFNPGGFGSQFVVLFPILKPQVFLRVAALGPVRTPSRRRCVDLFSDALCGDCEAFACVAIPQIGA
jgi:hypothetical protein